jgi:hypothetical protein
VDLQERQRRLGPWIGVVIAFPIEVRALLLLHPRSSQEEVVFLFAFLVNDDDWPTYPQQEHHAFYFFSHLSTST